VADAAVAAADIGHQRADQRHHHQQRQGQLDADQHHHDHVEHHAESVDDGDLERVGGGVRDLLRAVQRDGACLAFVPGRAIEQIINMGVRLIQNRARHHLGQRPDGNKGCDCANERKDGFHFI
jgi:hypothetical protein